MVDALNVAAYVLDQTGPISTMKLQKLVYYCDAYHLVRTGSPLFANKIEAWANGPVVRDLFDKHRGRYVIARDDLPLSRHVEALDREEKQTVDHVIQCIGHLTGAQLSDLTHSERPWIDQRRGVAAESRSSNQITPQAIRAFYGSPFCTNPIFA